MQRKRWKTILLGIVCAAAVGIIACGIYVSDFYAANDDAMAAINTVSTVEIREVDDNTYAFIPEQPKAGLIFYPGGKVEYTAYAPLMQAYAEQGFLCVLTEMPMNLAVLDINAADGIQEVFPDIQSWYIGGHSLGGSMAASYAADHVAEFDGLILLAAYSTADLTQSDLKVLSLYGSEDGVLNMEKYEKYRKNLPKSTVEYVIEGGCHSYFGSYGAQEGDGIPQIENKEQIRLTAEYCAGQLLTE